MTGTPTVVRPGRRWGGARLLKLLFFAQCALGALVVTADLPADLFDPLLRPGTPAPALQVPVEPGNQTRQFEPSRVPTSLPEAPEGAPGDAVPSRLEFTRTVIDGQGEAVLLNGSIADGDAARLADWLKEAPEPPSAFALNSPGGDVAQALAIGRLIRESGVPVIVAPGAYCFSACPYVLASGTERKVSRQAYVGVHQHYFGENTYLPAFLLVSDIQAGQGEVMTYLGEMGIDPMLMTKALMTPPDDIYVLVAEELETFRLATELLD